MKLNEFISAYYNCSFPERLNRAAIEYYRENSAGTQCNFFLYEMVRNNNYTMHTDDIRFITEVAPIAFPELFEAFLYAAYDDFKKKKIKPKKLMIIIHED